MECQVRFMMQNMFYARWSNDAFPASRALLGGRRVFRFSWREQP